MSTKHKIYADQDPEYYMHEYCCIVQFIFFPRWWNPVFMLSLLFYPWINAAFDAMNTEYARRNGRFWVFFQSLANSYNQVSDMLEIYKI